MGTQTMELDSRGFETTVLQATEPVLVDFWAPGCAPCRMIAPILAELADLYRGRLRVVQLNADDHPDIASRYGIRGVPTMLFFKDGREAHRVVGAWPRAKLTAAIEQVLAM